MHWPFVNLVASCACLPFHDVVAGVNCWNTHLSWLSGSGVTIAFSIMGKRSHQPGTKTRKSGRSGRSGKHIPKRLGGPQRPPSHSGAECRRGALQKLLPFFRCTKKTSWRELTEKNRTVLRKKQIMQMPCLRQPSAADCEVDYDDMCSYDFLPKFAVSKTSNPAPAYVQGAGGRMRRLRAHISDEEQHDD